MAEDDPALPVAFINETTLRTCVFRVLLAGLVCAVLAVFGLVGAFAAEGRLRWLTGLLLLGVLASGLGLGLVALGPSLVELWARRWQASLARDALAAALIFVTAFVGMELAVVQLVYTWTFAVSGSLESAREMVVSFLSDKVLDEPLHFLALGSILAAPFVSIFFRLRRVRLASQVLLGAGASLLCALPGASFFLYVEGSDGWAWALLEGLVISVAGALLPLACAGADKLEARFSRWREGDARGGA